MIVAVLGAGQLGRMLAIAGAPLGLRCRFLDPVPDSPASHVGEQIVASYNEPGALARFISGAAVTTYEFENVPAATASYLERHGHVFPPSRALEIAQDRLLEKQFFREMGVGTPEYAPIDSDPDLAGALARMGTPSILKTRRMGYDGKGQALLRDPRSAGAARRSLGSQPLILEGFVPFERELSIIAVRSRTGETAFYPLVQNEHRSGILFRSIAPAPGLTMAMQREAEAIAGAAMDALGYVGVLVIELFEVGGRLLVNEMACRVHNSGHWTIEGAETSQFENHLRAILGLPLGSTAARAPSVMLNLLGSTPPPEALLADRALRLHLYGKEPRPGRKIGHVTICDSDEASLATRAARAAALIEASTVLSA